jgi:hypothetical protein
MDSARIKEQIDMLASLVERANANNSAPIGRCDWTDVNGQLRCNNFSEFQCQQAGGQWTQNSSCP